MVSTIPITMIRQNSDISALCPSAAKRATAVSQGKTSKFEGKMNMVSKEECKTKYSRGTEFSVHRSHLFSCTFAAHFILPQVWC